MAQRKVDIKGLMEVPMTETCMEWSNGMVARGCKGQLVEVSRTIVTRSAMCRGCKGLSVAVVIRKFEAGGCKNMSRQSLELRAEGNFPRV